MEDTMSTASNSKAQSMNDGDIIRFGLTAFCFSEIANGFLRLEVSVSCYQSMINIDLGLTDLIQV